MQLRQYDGECHHHRDKHAYINLHYTRTFTIEAKLGTCIQESDCFSGKGANASNSVLNNVHSSVKYTCSLESMHACITQALPFAVETVDTTVIY